MSTFSAYIHLHIVCGRIHLTSKYEVKRTSPLRLYTIESNIDTCVEMFPADKITECVLFQCH